MCTCIEEAKEMRDEGVEKYGRTLETVTLETLIERLEDLSTEAYSFEESLQELIENNCKS